MSLNIFEIWDGIGRKTPFAVRRDHWSEEQYAIIEKIECEKMPYGKAFGHPIINGEYSNRFDYDQDWRDEKIIPCCGCYQWTLADDIEINKGKEISQQYKKRLNTANLTISNLNFGKYKGQTVEQVFVQDPKYIEWALINMEKFCLTKDSLESLEEFANNFKFHEQTKKINNQKLLRALKEI